MLCYNKRKLIVSGADEKTGGHTSKAAVRQAKNAVQCPAHLPSILKHSTACDWSVIEQCHQTAMASTILQLAWQYQGLMCNADQWMCTAQETEFHSAAAWYQTAVKP
jgi:hypothetical protein